MPARRTRRTRDKRTVVHTLNACFVCGKCFYTPNRLIIHFRKQHSIALFPRKQNARRPESKLFRFESDSKKYYDPGHYGCPSCWFQSQKYRLDTLENHIITEHVAVDAVEEEDYGSQEYNEEEEDEYQMGSSEVEELEGTCDKQPQERIGRKGFESMNFDEEEEADQLESSTDDELDSTNSKDMQSKAKQEDLSGAIGTVTSK